jgi:hypothetical protein
MASAESSSSAADESATRVPRRMPRSAYCCCYPQSGLVPSVLRIPPAIV